MPFTGLDALLDPTPLPLETGFERDADGVLHIACRTDLHGVTGEMFEWWFRSRPLTRQYVWWHPIDHVASNWAEGVEGELPGSIHLAEERFGHLPAQRIAVQFRDPEEFFTPAAYRQARDEGRITGAVCGRVGNGFEPERDEDGRVLGNRLLHLCRDTPWGSALRSNFYFGVDLVGKLTPQQIAETFTDEFGREVLRHCYNEFTFLARFLPSLYAGEHRDTIPVTAPW
ncbi:DAPG hydrolase family protein [Kitasatospora sp. NPDC057512]|uniref:DAPG hydrolase family protein n=1 Tax=Kitasatospora sp. NPDC057512 TaxID=3346154 RepID=UPI0036B773D1